VRLFRSVLSPSCAVLCLLLSFQLNIALGLVLLCLFWSVLGTLLTWCLFEYVGVGRSPNVTASEIGAGCQVRVAHAVVCARANLQLHCLQKVPRLYRDSASGHIIRSRWGDASLSTVRNLIVCVSLSLLLSRHLRTRPRTKSNTRARRSIRAPHLVQDVFSTCSRSLAVRNWSLSW
jgi:hypothetical protein